MGLGPQHAGPCPALPCDAGWGLLSEDTVPPSPVVLGTPTHRRVLEGSLGSWPSLAWPHPLTPWGLLVRGSPQVPADTPRGAAGTLVSGVAPESTLQPPPEGRGCFHALLV